MKITIISGSHRENSQSSKVAAYIRTTLLDNQLCDNAEIIDLANNPLPLWHEDIWSGDAQWTALLAPLLESLASSDAFVVVTPEWHGQVPAGLKNFFLMCSAKEVGHKPALLVSVSAVDGGATPIAELRMSSYKNNRLCYIPEQIVVRNVESVLNEAAEANNAEADAYFRERITWAATLLAEYAKAFTLIRASGKTMNPKFANGM